MSEGPTFLKRNCICGALDAEWVGREVILNGWVNRRRDHGGLIFVDLRDRSGVVQVVVDPSHAPEAHATTGEVRGEYVLAIRGTVRRRPEGTENAEMATGDVEGAGGRGAGAQPLGDAALYPPGPERDG